MTSAAEIISRLESHGVQISLRGDDLSVKGKVQPEWVSYLREHKADLVSHLRESQSSTVPRSDFQWPDDIAAIIERFQAWAPPAEPFALKQGVTVSHPAKWKAAMLTDIAAGRGKGRDRYGAVQADLRAWDRM